MLWFRRNQKMVLIPLAIVIIPSFVLLGVLSSNPGDNASALVVGDDSYSLKQLRGFFSLTPQTSPDELINILKQYSIAKKAGVRVSATMLNDNIKSFLENAPIKALPADKKETLKQRKSRLTREMGISLNTIKEYFTIRLTADVYMRTFVQTNGHITDNEFYLSAAAKGEQLTVREQSFNVYKHFGAVLQNQAPTEAEIKAFYDVVSKLPVNNIQNTRNGTREIPWNKNDVIWELLLLTTPKVACEYTYITKADAEAKAKKMLEASKNLELSGANETALLVADISYNKRLEEKYNQVKAQQFKRDEKGENGEDLFKSFDEVKSEVIKLVEEDVLNTAAYNAIISLQDKIEAEEIHRIITPDAATIGLGGGLVPAKTAADVGDVLATSGVAAKYGAKMGYTQLKPEQMVGTIKDVGNFRAMGMRAIYAARSSDYGHRYFTDNDTSSAAVMYRAVEFNDSRTQTFEEAKGAISQKLGHIKAAKLALAEANAFNKNLAERKIKPFDIKNEIKGKATDPKVMRYVQLAIGEFPSQPFSVKASRAHLDNTEKRSITNYINYYLRSLDSETKTAYAKTLELLKARTFAVGVVVARESMNREDFDPTTVDVTSDRISRMYISNNYLVEMLGAVEVVKKDAYSKLVRR